MNMRRTTCLATAALVSGVLSYLAMSGQLATVYSNFMTSAPKAEYPKQIDLGSTERGRTTSRELTIANRGGRDLIIDQISTSCACGGLEREENGRLHQVSLLRLKPNEEKKLVMRVTPAAVGVGKRVLTKISFRTNDPDVSEGSIEAVVNRVTGGIVARPRAIVFGSLPLGETFREIVDIQDTAEPTRVVQKVSTTRPDLVTVRLLQPEKGEYGRQKDVNGAVSARAEVSIRGEKPGFVDAAIHVFLAGEERPPDVIPIVGRVRAPFEILPARIVLPRIANGKDDYAFACTCVNNVGGPFHVTLESVPPGMKVQILDSKDSPHDKQIQISLEPAQTPHRDTNTRMVRFRANDGRREGILELAVVVDR